MASLITVQLNKGGSPNWGFRLQGGSDFGTPLMIQKVNGGSPAERAGLIPGDSVIRINNTDVFTLRHKDAQDVVVRAGPAFEMTIQRGGSTWKPSVTPIGSYSTPTPSINNVSPVTKTSLAAQRTENIGAIGTGHNVSAKPFNAEVNGAVNGGPKLVNKQYNSPLKLYSEESIAETITAQSEVLSTGVVGVNFKKNEKNYDATNSAVYRMLQEAEKEPRSPEQSEPDAGILTAPNSGIAGLRHVTAPETKPTPPTPQLPPGQNICADCERLIVGVFVRIKDKNLHVECFKCSTCGTSLKNVGYYNINNKLYCDVHAKLAARTNPPAPNLVPVTVPPGGRVPANAISSALATHSLPSQSALSPKANSSAAPFQSGGILSGPKPFSSVAAPLSPHNTLPRAAPLSPQSTLPRAAPLSPIASAPAPTFSPAPSTGHNSVLNIVWPPVQEEPELPTASPLYFPPPSQVNVPRLDERQVFSESTESEIDFSDLEEVNIMSFDPKLSIYSEEFTSLTGRRSATECIETISETLETQKLVEGILKTRSRSPPPLDQDVIVSDPPAKKTDLKPIQKPVEQTITWPIRRESAELKRPTEFSPNTIECQLKSKIENAVPQAWESQMVQALRTIPDKSADPFEQIPSKRSTTALASALVTAPATPFTPMPPISLEPVPLPEYTDPYIPPEHPIIIEKKETKIPAEPVEKTDSMFVSALRIAPDRPWSPIGPPPKAAKKKKDPMDEYLTELPKPQEKLSMLAALTTAPDRPYSPLIIEGMKIEETKETSDVNVKKTKTVDKTNLQKPLKPQVLPESFQVPTQSEIKCPPYIPVSIHEKSSKEQDIKETKTDHQTDVKQVKTIERHYNPGPVVEYDLGQQISSSYPPIFQGFTCSFQNKSDRSQFSVNICTTPPVLTPERSRSTPNVQKQMQSGYTETETITEETRTQEQTSEKQKQLKESKEVKIAKQAEDVILKKPLPLAACLHKPETVPQYQVNLSESVEADLKLMEKIESSKIRHEQKKATAAAQQPPVQPRPIPAIITPKPTPTEPTKKPVTTVPQDVPKIVAPQMTFQPVVEDRPPSSTTFSPRPRPLTPSMINKPPAVLPYYQASLVAQQYSAPVINLLAPTSPEVSRSPSPCPDRRSPSPFPRSAPSSARPKSPAAGPPPNPLRSHQPPPTPRDWKFEEAKKNVSEFIPQHMSRNDLVEQAQRRESSRARQQIESRQKVDVRQQVESRQKVDVRQQVDSRQKIARQQVDNARVAQRQELQPTKMYVSDVETRTQPVQQKISSSISTGAGYSEKSLQMQNLQVQDAQKRELAVSQTAQGSVATETSEKTHLEHMEELKKKQSQSVQISGDGLVQVRRNKTVTEEFEHSQKAQTIQIEKNVTTTSRRPFHDVNAPSIEPGVMGLHVTNPQHISSPFITADENGWYDGNPVVNVTLPMPKPRTDQKSEPKCQKKCVPPCEPCQPKQEATASSQAITAQAAPQPKALPTSSQPPTRHVYAPPQGPLKHVSAPGSSQRSNQSVNKPNIPVPNAGAGGGRQAGAVSVATKRGRGILNAAAIAGARIPLCGQCHSQIRGPFITALGKIWCPEHFICATPSCRRPLQDLGFVEERGQLYCEYCFEQYIAPPCAKCSAKIKGDCLKAIGKNFHPECFNCVYCGKLFGNSPFFLEDGSPYCETDWNELFTTKCFACGFPVEAGDRWVEALNNNYHSQCFNCTMCKKNLEGQSFFAKGGRPFCKNHAR